MINYCQCFQYGQCMPVWNWMGTKPYLHTTKKPEELLALILFILDVWFFPIRRIVVSWKIATPYTYACGSPSVTCLAHQFLFRFPSQINEGLPWCWQVLNATKPQVLAGLTVPNFSLSAVRLSLTMLTFRHPGKPPPCFLHSLLLLWYIHSSIWISRIFIYVTKGNG